MREVRKDVILIEVIFVIIYSTLGCSGRVSLLKRELSLPKPTLKITAI